MKKYMFAGMIMMFVLVLSTFTFAEQNTQKALLDDDFPTPTGTSKQVMGSTGTIHDIKSTGSHSLMPCLDQCQGKFETCMGSAGDDPSKRFRCGEERTSCTLSCDSQYYDHSELEAMYGHPVN